MTENRPDDATPPLRAALQEEVRFRVLRLLQNNPEMSQRELAAALGVSLGRVNYVLKALVEKGLVKFANFSAAPDKRRYAYVLTPRGLAEKAALTGRFLRRKTAEFEALKAEIEALRGELSESADEAGRRQGHAPGLPDSDTI